MDAAKHRKIIVVGAGVIGLTTAIRLREQGHEVLVMAQEMPSTILSRDESPLKDEPPGTYSSTGAGGLWMPFLLEGEGVERWSTAAHKEFTRQRDDNVGVDILEAFMLQARSTPTELPWFAKLTNMTVETHETDSRIPPEYAAALRFSTPIIEMWPYMRHLEERALGLGVTLELTSAHTAEGEPTQWSAGKVAEFALERFPEERPVVINCCGIGARKLADEDVTPIRGIIVRVKRPPEKRYMISEDPDNGYVSKDGMLAYCIPRGEEYSLGGTALRGDWRETVSEEEANGVKERANKLIPGIGSMEETGVWAGFRPVRKEGSARVGIQQEGLEGKEGLDVIANYGHGGSGVTTSWGCADEVVQIVNGLGAE